MKIKVCPDTILGEVENIKTSRNNIESYYSEMETTVESLVSDNYMEGEAATRYVEEFKEKVRPSLDSTLQVLDEITAAIEEIVNDMLEQEKQLVGAVFG